MPTRGTRNSKSMWVAGGLLATVLVLTGYMAFSGDDEETGPPGPAGGSASAAASPSPAPSYTRPEEWTEPDRWAALPRGQRTDAHGSQVGYPKSTEGAVSMMAAANSMSIDSERDAADEQLRIYRSYFAAGDQSDETAEKIELNAAQTDKLLRKELGLPAGGPLPAGAYMRNTVVGYKVIKESDDEVSVWLLTRVVRKGGETSPERASYSRSLSAAAWKDGDWKLSGEAFSAADTTDKPAIVAPGDAAFNDAGWVAIREAS
ncbi:hypothetical protein ACIPK5_30785 [Streptomyces sp. NPDC086843]|uniref:hypothetical protein n=1 Tax=Streptomyces sp. NPDC086843 TaxID=3365763 RepID=UPI00380AFED5